MRGRALWLVCLCCAWGCYSSAPTFPAKGEDEVTVLVSARTRAEVGDRLGTVPRCFTFAPETEVCEWRLAGGAVGHGLLSEQMGVEDRISVICELPADGSARSAGTCTFHQRRSNRASFRRTPGTGRGSERIREENEELERKIAQAKSDVREATSALAIARLVGELPESCESDGAGGQRCVWVLSNQANGHGTVAASIDAGFTRKVRMVCVFGADGERTQDCTATEL